MTDFERLMTTALQERGVSTLEAFEERYGVALDAVPLDVSLALVLLPDHPRARDREAWTPVQRENYVAGCMIALTTLKERLEHGLTILTEHPSVAVEVRWLRLATQSMRMIGKMSDATIDAGAAFCESPLGKWYATLAWPQPSDGALREKNTNHHPCPSSHR